MILLATLIFLGIHLTIAWAFNTLLQTNGNYSLMCAYLIGALGAALYGNVENSLKGKEDEQARNED